MQLDSRKHVSGKSGAIQIKMLVLSGRCSPKAQHSTIIALRHQLLPSMIMVLHRNLLIALQQI
ncbi:hypothetical protein [Nitrosomonas ureae]|uniref:hypothetical protein n=1 Tax=Nitrosomonas ureae TaxID=44577 RepID=UPI000BE37635|nr:hypothetical protein [Nitrosomonas ureae]